MDVFAIVLVGFVAGFLGGLLGVGGGILLVPAFLFFLKDRIPDIHVAVGTSMAVIVVNALAGTVQHAWAGRVNWQIVAYLAAVAVIGGSLGGYVSGHVNKVLLQRLFAVLLMAVALKMFFSKPGEAAPQPSARETAAVVGVGRDSHS